MEHGGGALRPLVCWMAEERSEISAMPLPGESGELPADAPEHAAGAGAWRAQCVRQIALDRIAGRQACIPAAQGGERIGIGQ
jgi:hypothetical protein